MAMIRSGMIVLVANCVDVGAVLARNVILARLLSVEQFGLASTFAILMTMIETFQNVGLNRLVVQNARADDPSFVASLHGAQIVVSMGAAAVLALLAFPFAMLMGTPSLAPAYLLMAIVPLVNAFTNLESFRVQREGRFGPQVIRSLLSQPIGLLVILPAYWWLGDHRTALVAIIAQQAAAAILTHVAAGRPYRVAFDRLVWRRVMAFGWPLIANGLLMFLILDGDRMVVLNRFGPAALGWFSAAVMLTLTPANLIAKSLQTITLPALARAQAEPLTFRRIYDASLACAALIVVGMVVGTLLLGELVLTALFGAKFLPASAFLTALACMNGMRLFRAVPAIAAMARGDSRNPLYANFVRVLGVPAALIAALAAGAIAPMLLAGVLTELASAAVASVLARRQVGANGHCDALILSMLALCVSAAFAVSYYGGYLWLILLPPVAALVFICVSVLDPFQSPALSRFRLMAAHRSRRA